MALGIVFIYLTESALKSTKVWNCICSKKLCAIVLSTWVHRFPSQLSAQLSWVERKEKVLFFSLLHHGWHGLSVALKQASWHGYYTARQVSAITKILSQSSPYYSSLMWWSAFGIIHLLRQSIFLLFLTHPPYRCCIIAMLTRLFQRDRQTMPAMMKMWIKAKLFSFAQLSLAESCEGTLCTHVHKTTTQGFIEHMEFLLFLTHPPYVSIN